MTSNRSNRLIYRGAAWALLVCLIVPSLSFSSEGTGVGSGGNEARDQYLAKLRRELSLTRAAPRASNDLISWCSRVTTILLREKQRGMIQYQRGNPEGAETILIDALVTAAESLVADPQIGGPMTKKLIDRTLLGSEALEALPARGSSMATRLKYLFDSIDFIVKTSRELDTPYYIPYRFTHDRCRHCPPEFNLSAFEAEFVRVSASQLDFARRTFTLRVTQPEGHFVFLPLGDPKAFLRIAELTAAHVSKDLTDNLYEFLESCIAADLKAFSEILAAYNLSGDRSYFPNDPWAVDATASKFAISAHQIRSKLTQCPNLELLPKEERSER